MDERADIGNGFFPLANTIAEAFARNNVPGNEMRLIWVVMRKTWGFKQGERRKDFDHISLSQFILETGMNRRNVSRGLKELVAKRLLLKTLNGYGINRYVNDWVLAKRLRGVANVVSGRGKRGIKVVAKRLPTKENKIKYTKETNINTNINKGQFIKPSLEDVTAYFKELSLENEAAAFFDHFETRNWVPKGYTKQMSNWKAAARNWKRTSQKGGFSGRPRREFKPSPSLSRDGSNSGGERSFNPENH